MKRLLLVVLVIMLAACGNENEPQAKPTARVRYVTATPQPHVTVVVTLPPTRTPEPTPTLSYDIVAVGGSWAMRFRVSIMGSDYVDELTYNGAAILSVNPDGSISGSGSFTPSIRDDVCNAHVLDENPIGFTVQGSTRPDGDQIWASIELKPDSATQRENYELVCPDYNDVRYRREAILWPVLNTLGRLKWDFELSSGQTFTFASDLAAEIRSGYTGQLSGEVTLNRN